MRTSYLTILFLLVTFTFVTGQRSATGDGSEEAAKIDRSISEISKAYVQRSYEPFERLYLENFTSIKKWVIYNTREQLIAMMKADAAVLRSGKKPDFETIDYSNEKPRIMVFGNSAVVTLSRKHHWQYQDEKCLSRIQATELWIKREDRWKVAVSHGSTIRCDPQPNYPQHLAVATIPSIKKAPRNDSPEAEQRIREIIDSLVNSRLTNEGTLDEVIDRHTLNTFISTDVDGNVGRDRSMLRSIPALPRTRSVFGRNNDPAVTIYDDAAVYTYRLRAASADDDRPLASIMFVKESGRWQIAAAHVSLNVIE